MEASSDRKQSEPDKKDIHCRRQQEKNGHHTKNRRREEEEEDGIAREKNGEPAETRQYRQSV